MVRALMAAAAAALMMAGCGLVDGDGMDDTAAIGGVVAGDAVTNSEPVTDSETVAGSATADGDGASVAPDPAGADGESEAADLDADSTDNADVNSGDPGVAVTAPGTLIELAGGPEEWTPITTDMASPVLSYGDLRIDRAWTTAGYDSIQAEPGSMLVIAEFQLMQTVNDANSRSTRITDEMLRADIGGRKYPNRASIHRLVTAGQVVNTAAVFEIPVDTTDFTIEAGVPEESIDGYSHAYPATVSTEPVPVLPSIDDAAIDGDALSITRSAGTESVTPDLDWAARGIDQMATVEVLGARSAARLGPDGAGPAWRWVVVDAQLSLGTGRHSLAFSGPLFRLGADGEWYSPVNQVNEFMNPGDVFSGELVFLVPRSVSSVTLEAGPAEYWDMGRRAAYDIELPGP